MKDILKDVEKKSHEIACDKALTEYEKYRIVQDQKYISSMDEFYNKYLKENNNTDYS